VGRFRQPSFNGALALAAASAEPTKSAEDVVEHRKDVADVHVGEVVLAVDALVAELVVAFAFFGIGEDFVSFGAFFEFDDRLFVVRIPIRMIF